ncbi:hypothetical protein [Streptomyces mesophilus]|uniref:hypothetical protein n=1 Tax=Streptomyces mesophilus TaxID=1775132 RepID=UPI0033329B1F
MAAGHHDPGGVGSGSTRSGGVFEPARPASRGRLVFAFLLGAVVWAAAGVLAIVLLGHSHILRTLLFAVVISWLVFALALLWGIALRHKEERRERP